MNTNRPNINPANNDSFAGLIQYSFAEYQKSVQGLLPARVIKYDRNANRVSVQLLIKLIGTSGKTYQNTQISNLPVMLLGGGDFFVSANLNPGDLGWLFATDRDISLFLDTYKEAAPSVNLVKNFSSSFFIPDIMTGYTISSEDASNFLISNKNASVKISLGADTITVTAPNVTINTEQATVNATNVTLTTEQTTVNASTDMTINGNTIINGSLTINGDMTGSGTISADYVIPQSGNFYVQGNIQAEGDITAHVPP